MAELTINDVKLNVSTAELKAALQTSVTILKALNTVLPANIQQVDQTLVDALTYTANNDILLGILSSLLTKV